MCVEEREDAIVALRRLVQAKVSLQATYRSFAKLRTDDDATASALVCHFLREATRASMSLLIVG